MRITRIELYKRSAACQSGVNCEVNPRECHPHSGSRRISSTTTCRRPHSAERHPASRAAPDPLGELEAVLGPRASRARSNGWRAAVLPRPHESRHPPRTSTSAAIVGLLAPAELPVKAAPAEARRRPGPLPSSLVPPKFTGMPD
jgi:hypothetical protein